MTSPLATDFYGIADTSYGPPCSVPYLDLSALDVWRETRRPLDEGSPSALIPMTQTQAVAVQDQLTGIR